MTSKLAYMRHILHEHNCQSTSNVGYNYYLWSSHIIQMMSDVAFYHHCSLNISICGLWTWPTNIICSMLT